MTGASVMERVFAAEVENVTSVVEYVAAQAGEAGLHPRRVMHLQLAVEEAVMNVFSYAYQIPPGELTVRLRNDQRRFEVELVDEGIPFDPLTLVEPDVKAEIEERSIGGLGILLIRRVMDEVHYQRINNQNVATLVVYK